MKVKYFIFAFFGLLFALGSTFQDSFADSKTRSQTIYFPEIEKIDHDFEKKPLKRKYKIGSVEAYSHHDVEFIPSRNHAFIDALRLGFNYHKPIIISPDHIWLLICQGFANHVNHSPEELRHFFVNFEGKKELTVRRDNFVKGKENPWENIFPEFAKQIKDQIGEPVNILVADFSTTGIIEKTAFQITLMSTFKKYFDSILLTLCGFPSITIEGTPEDWQDILRRAKLLREYDLEWWIDELEPILKEFINASQGEFNRSFWKSIFRYNEQSGGNVINGWITKFFPYILIEKLGPGIFKVNPLVSKKHKDFSDLPLDFGIAFRDASVEAGNGSRTLQMDKINENPSKYYGMLIGNFSSGMANVPFKWFYYDKTFNMEFIAGFIGITQDEDSEALRAEIGWVVKEKKQDSDK